MENTKSQLCRCCRVDNRTPKQLYAGKRATPTTSASILCECACLRATFVALFRNQNYRIGAERQKNVLGKSVGSPRLTGLNALRASRDEKEIGKRERRHADTLEERGGYRVGIYRSLIKDRVTIGRRARFRAARDSELNPHFR